MFKKKNMTKSKQPQQQQVKASTVTSRKLLMIEWNVNPVLDPNHDKRT